MVGDEPSTSSTCDDSDDVGRGLLPKIVVSAARRPHLSPLDGLDGGEVDGGGQGWEHTSHDVVRRRG